VAVRDPEATRSRILKAAAKEFAAKGIAGARVDAIAERARVNKRMLYHYFGAKDALFREVLRRELTARVTKARQRGGSRVDRLVARQVDHARDRDWVRLLHWEALEWSTRRTTSDATREGFYRDWVESIRRDQEDGIVPADLDAAHLALSELALTLFPAAFPQLTQWITGRAVTDPQFVSDREAVLRTAGSRLLEPPLT
jgi:AcrR family transcriptional regulator